MERMEVTEQYSAKMYGEFIGYLQVRYDSRADFYKKAKLIKYNNGWYSQTTGRHINEFLLQNGFEKMTKKEMEE